ncbi:MAG: hypothetical protein AB1629_01700 [Candidatus Omnitrophota bacterium]
MAKKILFLVVIFFLVSSSLFADTIILKSGKQIDAKILERTNERLKVEIAGVPITYFLDEIDSVNGEKVGLSLQDKPVSKPTGEVVSAAPEQSIASKDFAEETENKSTIHSSPDIKDMPKVPPAVMATIGIIILVSFLLLYVYTSVCLQLISRKASQGPVWLAWIPIAQFFLMCKIGGISYLWLLLLLLSFIPIVGMLSSLALSGFIWYKIALARQKPGWLGILAVLPLVGLVFIGYLAFSE